MHYFKFILQKHLNEKNQTKRRKLIQLLQILSLTWQQQYSGVKVTGKLKWTCLLKLVLQQPPNFIVKYFQLMLYLYFKA